LRGLLAIFILGGQFRFTGAIQIHFFDILNLKASSHLLIYLQYKIL